MKIILKEIDNKELTTVNKLIWRNNMYDKYQEILNNQELRKNKSRKKKKNIFLLIINRTKDTANILGISISKKIIYHKKSGRQAIV